MGAFPEKTFFNPSLLAHLNFHHQQFDDFLVRNLPNRTVIEKITLEIEEVFILKILLFIAVKNSKNANAHTRIRSNGKDCGTFFSESESKLLICKYMGEHRT